MKKVIIFILILILGLLAYFKWFGPSDKQVEMAVDIYCATFQARDESGLGKSLYVLRPRIMTTEETSSNGQQFIQITLTKMMPLMKKYGWDIGKLGQETKKADELMTKESFRKKVFDLLRKNKECHPEYLD